MGQPWPSRRRRRPHGHVGAAGLKLTLLVEYDGTDFHGSQLQPGLRTAQGALQQALLHVTGEPIVAEFAGRTDAGVHAAGQVVSVETTFRHGPRALQRALNVATPADLSVLDSAAVDPAFSARRSARQRWYRYTVHNGPQPRPLSARYASFHPQPLDVQAMNAAAAELLGWHDFSAFGDVPNDHSSPVRRLDTARVERQGDTVTIDLRATAFLRHMARSMTGLLLRAGTHSISPIEARRVLDERDRSAAGPVAPAKGLCLMGVLYDSPLPYGEGQGEDLHA